MGTAHSVLKDLKKFPEVLNFIIAEYAVEFDLYDLVEYFYLIQDGRRINIFSSEANLDTCSRLRDFFDNFGLQDLINYASKTSKFLTKSEEVKKSIYLTRLKMFKTLLFKSERVLLTDSFRIDFIEEKKTIYMIKIDLPFVIDRETKKIIYWDWNKSEIVRKLSLRFLDLYRKSLIDKKQTKENV